MKNLLPVLMLLAVGLFFTACNNDTETTSETSSETTEKTADNERKVNVPKGYKIGDVVENFSLMNVDDKTVSLEDYKDQKGAIVIFTCNTCPYSVAYEDRIIELHEKFEKEGYPVIAINPNDPAARPKDDFRAMKVRAEEKKFSFPYLFDDGQKIYPTFGATKTPHVFVLNNNGNGMEVAYIGAIDDNSKDAKAVKTTYLADAIDALMNGKKPTPAETKAVGCSIKVKGM